MRGISVTNTTCARHARPAADERDPSIPSSFDDLVARRYSPLAFDARAVAPQTLRQLFDAARWAASSMNEQPWRFIVATRDDTASFEKILSTLVPGNAAWAAQAPVLVLSVARKNFERGDHPNRFAQHDVGQAMAQLSLAATERGLGVHQMGGFDAEQARALFHIPAEYEPVAAIALGYPGDVATLPEALRQRSRAPRTRRELESIVFGGTWGEPAALVKTGAAESAPTNRA
jgi:nitroreductase